MSAYSAQNLAKSSSEGGFHYAPRPADGPTLHPSQMRYLNNRGPRHGGRQFNHSKRDPHSREAPKERPRAEKNSEPSALNTPEEVQKWIEARRKNFPTRANIERKKREEELKREKGVYVPQTKRENLSLLEVKLRKKIRFIGSSDKPGKSKRRSDPDKGKTHANESSSRGVKRLHDEKATREADGSMDAVEAARIKRAKVECEDEGKEEGELSD